MTLEKVEHCPICNSNSFQHLLTCKDFTSSSQLFHVEQCKSCQLLLTNPRPQVTEAPNYYLSSQYISHSSQSTGILDSIYLLIRRLTIRWKLRLITAWTSGNLLLDYGCGTGSFLHHCQSRGMETFGVEPSPSARSIASSNGVSVVESPAQLPATQFNAITLWHVLEHIYDLTGTLTKLKSLLADNGTIFIAVPNWESNDAKHYKELWAAYDVPRHVWHFNKNSMEQLVNQSGLKLKAILPMKLDSYYVSMLSEKYKANGQTKVTGIIRAVVNGLKSNFRAKSSMNYSSLIYIIQK